MSRGIWSPVSRVLISFCFYSSVSLTKPQIYERLLNFNYPNEIDEALEVVLPMFVLFRCWCVMFVLLIKQVQSEFYAYLSVHRTGNCPALFDNPARSYRTLIRNRSTINWCGSCPAVHPCCIRQQFRLVLYCLVA